MHTGDCISEVCVVSLLDAGETESGDMGFMVSRRWPLVGTKGTCVGNGLGRSWWLRRSGAPVMCTGGPVRNGEPWSWQMVRGLQADGPMRESDEHYHGKESMGMEFGETKTRGIFLLVRRIEITLRARSGTTRRTWAYLHQVD